MDGDEDAGDCEGLRRDGWVGGGVRPVKRVRCCCHCELIVN